MGFISGVPQGSPLGPLLIILFTNNIPNIFCASNCLMFADDLKIFRTVQSHQDALNLQRNLDMFSSRCQRNRLFLNINKCKVMSFHRKKSPILFDYNIDKTSFKRVHVMQDLGVFFYPTISFVHHVVFIVTKAYSMLGFILRICTDFNAASILRSFFFHYLVKFKT